MYYIYLVWNGNKRQVADKYLFVSKEAWEDAINGMPFDIIDADEHNCWVDFGDL